MGLIKASEKVEFDVIYADGTRKRVHEGVLFESENDEMIFHNGTNRAVVLFASAEAALEVIDAIGLTPLFKRYIRIDVGDNATLRILADLLGGQQFLSEATEEKS